MKSFRNWQLIQESFIPGINLGLSKPQNLGLNSDLGLSKIDEKKKTPGKVMRDEDGDCGCVGKKNMKEVPNKKSKKEEKVPFSKKKVKKHMEDDVDDISGDEDINSVKISGKKRHGDEDDDDVDFSVGDDVDGDEDHEDGDEDVLGDEDHDDDMDDDEEGLEGDDDMDDDGEDAPKFGFMKDKKNKRRDENSFWEDIDANYQVPSEEGDTDEEFFNSLARQYGNPRVRHNGGVERVDEDLLLSDEQQALIDAMPQPGEIGYAPTARVGDNYGYSSYEESDDGDYTDEDSDDFEVLTKYFAESVAHDLISKKNKRNR